MSAAEETSTPRRRAAASTTLITDQDLRAHVVGDEQLGSLMSGGSVQGVCGRVFLPAALTAPMGRTCALCDAVVNAVPPQPPGRRRGWRAMLRKR